MRKQFFFIVTALFACNVSVDATLVWNGTSALWTSGDGTQASPFLLEKPEHLSQLSKNVSNGTNYEGKWFRMTEDFDMDGTSSRVITPIGKDDTHAFKGHFDGNGHSISNVLLNCMSTQYCAMFGYVDGATIENLKVENVSYFTGSSTLTYSAILSAHAKGGTFSNITTDGNMTINDGVYCGALVGYVENGASIRQCVNLADIALNATNQNAALGGIVGYNKEGATLFMTETVNEGTLALNVVSSDNSKSDESAVGGLLGMTSLAIQIEKSFSKGAISADIKHNHNGYFTITTGSSNYSTSRRSTTGRIGTTHVFYYNSIISAGGLVGKIIDGAAASAAMSMVQCSNSGDIVVTNTGTYTHVTTNAGGLLGSSYAVSSAANNILSCYSKCNITVPSSTAVQNNAPKRKISTIPSLSFPGVISGTIPVGTGTGGSTGGSLNTTTVYYHYAAGVLGDKVATFNLKVQNCYYAGLLTGQKVDGLSVDVINDYSNNYYLDACGAENASAYGAALAEEQMKSNALPMVLNNDGDDIFVKDDYNVNGGYPIFAYQLPQQHTLTLLADAAEGSVTGGGEYDNDVSATITATPKTGYRFVRWSDGNTDNPRTLTLTNDLTLTAEFEAIKYMITAISSDELKGTVSGSGEYAYMSETEISATPAEGYIFKQWSDGNTDNPRTITLTQDTTLIAEFDAASPTQYTLTLSVNDSDMGMVSGVAGTYDDGTEVTITAMPKDLYLFRRWSDGVTDNPRVLNMDNDISLIAIFTPVGSSINEHSSGIGSFSVSSSKKVTFSPGNVQYQASSGTWRFAEHQWDYVGNGNYGTVYQDDVKSQNSQVGSNYSGWIDYFGWGTGNAPTKVRSNYKDYLSFTDWGTNAISNGGNKAGMWYTLSKDEWSYLLHGRDNYDKLFGLGTVAGVNGIIILPDDWSKPQGLSFSPSVADGLSWNESYYIQNGVNHYSDNTYTVTQWEKMEASGAVFLPASGSRSGYVETDGSYWTSTQDGTTTAHALYFYASYVNSQRGLYALYYGFSVRLVRTLPNNPTFTITFSNDDGTVLQSSPVRYGVVPSYNGSTPTKPSTAQYTYTFNGWNKDIVSVTSDATYTATYSRTKNKYTVVFYDADGVAMLGQQEVEYGSSATAPDVVIPECRSLSWDKDFSNVTEDLIVKVVWQYIPMASGYCGAEGDNLTWELSCDSVLTISGTGAMSNYSEDGGPWRDYKRNIRYVILDDGITTIGANAFYMCGVRSIQLPNTLTYIGGWALASTGLTSVEIPNGVTEIGSDAFRATPLTSIFIPSTVKDIGFQVFNGCSSLTRIVVDPNNTVYDSRNDCNAIIVSRSNTLLYGCLNTVIPADVTRIGDDAFASRKKLTSITIPDGVVSIAENAFYYCTDLKSIVLPASVEKIERDAFSGCSSMERVEFRSATPPVFNITTALGVAKTSGCFFRNPCDFYVPCGTKDAYIAALNKGVREEYLVDSSRVIELSSPLSYTFSSTDETKGMVSVTEEMVACDSIVVVLHAEAKPGYMFTRWNNGREEQDMRITITKQDYDGYHFEAFFYDSIGFTNLPIISATPYTATVAATTNLTDMTADWSNYSLAGFEVRYENGNGVGGGFILPCDVKDGNMQATLDLHHAFAKDALGQYPFDEVYYRPYYTSPSYYVNVNHPIWNEHIGGEWIEITKWERDYICSLIEPVFIDVDLCEGETFNVGGNGLTPLDGGVGETSITRTYQSRLGCDSVVTYRVHYHPKYAVTLYDTICSVDNYVFGGRQLTEPGSYTDSLTSIWGCDSIVTLVLKVNELNELRETATVCATELPYLWRGESIKEGGTYTVTEDCNVYTLVLKVNELNELRETATVCATELPYLWRGESIKESGTYTVTEDCNVYTLVLTVDECEPVETGHWETFRRAVVPREQGTICLPYDVSEDGIFGADVYRISGFSNAKKNYVLYEPVHSMQAGYAYIFEVLPGVHEIAFMYYADGNPSPAVTASQGNPLQGFIGETPNERLDLEIGVYFLYNKQWRLIDYPGYYILSNRAYLILEYVTPYGQVPSSVAARSRVVSLFDTTEQTDWTGASDDYSTPTDVEQNASQTALPKKVLIDGHLYVLMPDGTLYSVTGQKTNR